MSKEQTLTAQQRAMLFGASTRQHIQMLGAQNINGGAQTVSFRVPKSRIMQGVRLYVDGKINVKHASQASKTIDKLAIYDVLRRISIDFNNGFNPIVVSGSEMAMVNMLYPNPSMVYSSTDGSTLATCPSPLKCSAEGTDNAFSFMLDVPLTVNYRDPVGLVLAQNAETNIDIILDFNNPSQIINNESGFTLEFKDVTVIPSVTSFSIPSDTRCFPDMSVLKVVDSRNEQFTAGNSYIKLPVGMIYRKLILKFTDADGKPMKLDDINSNIELIMNTADTPYSISPKMLRAINKMQSGIDMPEGVYYWSFDYQGINGYGGSRDYIDTERVTEFAVRFTTGKAGKLHIISEKLSRLVAG